MAPEAIEVSYVSIFGMGKKTTSISFWVERWNRAFKSYSMIRLTKIIISNNKKEAINKIDVEMHVKDA